MTPSNSRKRSLDLAHELASSLLAQVDLLRHPIRPVDKGRLLKTADSQLDACPISKRAARRRTQVGEEGNQVIPVTFGPGEIAMLSALVSDEPIHGELLAVEPLRLRWLPIRELESVLQEDKLLSRVRLMCRCRGEPGSLPLR